MTSAAGSAANLQLVHDLSDVGHIFRDLDRELSLRFALAKSGISTVLVGLSELSHLESAIRWAERGPLPEDAVQRIVHAAH